MRVKRLFVGLLLSSFFATVSPVRAEIRQLDYTLTPEANQSFNGLIQHAERLAAQLIKESFANPSTTAIELKILAEREGLTAPILYVRVTRADWQKQSNLRSAFTYLRGADHGVYYWGSGSLKILSRKPRQQRPSVWHRLKANRTITTIHKTHGLTVSRVSDQCYRASY